MAHKMVTTKAGKKSSKAKKHKKPAHRAEIHKIENGFKALTHFEPDADDAGMMGGYQEPEEHAFSGADAGQQAMDHVSSAMGMTPAAAPAAAAPPAAAPPVEEAA
jgi:hypothetical protein